MKILSLTLGATLVAGASAQDFDYTVPPSGEDKCALINVVMDESGSMWGDQNFMKNTALPRMARELYNTTTYGYDHVFLCSTGFRDYYSGGQTTYARDLGCTVMTTTGGYKDSGVVAWTLAGYFEDGWHAMMTAMENVPSVIDSKNLLTTCKTIDKNLILVTDEDRDSHSADTVTTVKDKISANGYILNAIVNIVIDGTNDNLGMKIDAGQLNSLIFAGTDSNFTKTGNYTGYVTDFGTTHADYSELIVGTDGAIWNIHSLRSGGPLTQRFADTFVKVKVRVFTVHIHVGIRLPFSKPHNPSFLLSSQQLGCRDLYWLYHM